MTVIKICNIFFMEFCAVMMVAVGIQNWRSTIPVTFWNRQKAPKPEEITNIRSYNRFHGLLWMVLGAVLMVSLLTNFFTGKAHSGYTILGGIVLMLVFHRLIEFIYRKH